MANTLILIFKYENTNKQYDDYELKDNNDFTDAVQGRFFKPKTSQQPYDWIMILFSILKKWHPNKKSLIKH